MTESQIQAVSWRYNVAELWADGVVHVAGVVLAVGGTVVFLASSLGHVSTGALLAAAVYLATLILSIGISATYNIWPVSPFKWALRRFDHSAIFLLIAGTYTPFMVKAETWFHLAAVWTVAACGVVLKLAWSGRFDRLAVLFYLAIGWSGILAYNTLIQRLDPSVFALILAGGVVYSAGTIFHLWERLRFQNAIWHAFVLTAASIHFMAVWYATTPLV